MGTYSEIKLLIKDLNGSKVLQRRAAGEKLQSMLSQPEIRRRLAMEVSIPEGQRGRISIAGARKMALAEVWRYIIQSAVTSVQQIVDGKSKVTESDIQMPYKLIRSCDMQEHDDDSSQYANNPNLDKKTTRLVFEYCMEMLDNKAVVELAELTLLQMLAYICSRREYVAYFKPHGEMSAVLEEVEKRIIPNEEDDISVLVEHRVVLESAKIFENLIKTAVTELGIGMDLLLPGCVKLVSNWCGMNRNKGIVSELSHVMNGLSILLESNVEQSIAPLTRYGRTILSFVKAKYKNSTSLHRLALNKYLLRHLAASQVSGKLSGLMPGDMGDLGTASINDQQVFSLVELLLQDAGKFPDDIWPIESSHLIQLEVLARFLSCGQRIYLANAEWGQIEDPIKELTVFIENCNKKDNILSLKSRDEQRFRTCQAPNISESPFVAKILGQLYALAPDCSDTASFEHDNTDYVSMPHDVSSLLAATKSSSEKCRPDSKLLIPLLQVILTCAEIFPAGSCWASNYGESWKRLTMKDDCGFNESFWVNGSSPCDLAAVIHVVSNLLESYGSSSGTPNTQKWILLCLIRLTESSATYLVSYAEKISLRFFDKLQRAWCRVWSIIFRPDLRYTSWTKSTTQGSNGELVLTLLTNIIRYSCTCLSSDKTVQPKERNIFLAAHQSDLWTLPLFANVNTDSPIPFTLIYVVLFYLGLRDQTPSGLQHNKPVMISSTINIRQKLLLFCLQFFERYLERSRTCRLSHCLASICATSLCSGRPPLPKVLFGLLIDEPKSSIPPTFNHIISCFDMGGDLYYRPQYFDDVSSDTCFLFWGKSDVFPIHSINNSTMDSFLDDAAGDIIRIKKLIFLREESLKGSDFIPQSQSKQLFDMMRSNLDLLSNRYIQVWNQESIPDKSEAEVRISLSAQTLLVKICLTPLLARPSTLLAPEFEAIVNDVSQIFCSAANYINAPDSDQDDFSSACTDLAGIVIGILDVTSRLSLELPSVFNENALTLFKTCQTLLDSYTPGEGAHHSQSKAIDKVKTTVDDFLMDDDFDGDGSHCREMQRKQQLEFDDDAAQNRKRKRKEANRRQVKRNNSHRRGAIFLTQQCAFRVGALLIALNPSFSECEFVARMLTGLDDFDENVSPYDVDLKGCLDALELLCSDAPFMHQVAAKKSQEDNTGADKLSLASLTSQLIKLVRSASKAHSNLFLFGYHTCALLVDIADAVFHGSSLTEDEANGVVDLFRNQESSQERRHLVLRPGARARQLRSAIKMFKNGKVHLHTIFDKEFPRAFVLPSLIDINGTVRRLACTAVATAIQILPEERVIESVRKRLPPVACAGSHEEVKIVFRKWYTEKKIQGSDSNVTREKQAWEDAFLSLQFSVVECLGAVARASSNVEALEQLVFDLIQLASNRATLEGLVYQIIEQVAISAGHTNVKNFLEAHRDNLIQRWLQTGHSLLDTPIIMTAPQAICILLHRGQYSRFIADVRDARHDSEGEKGVFEQLKETAASEYMSRHCNVLLSQTFFLILQNASDLSESTSFRSHVLEDKYITELCSLFEDDVDENIVKILVKKHIASLMAQICLTKSIKGDCIETNFQMFFQDFLPERLGEKYSNVALRRLIEVIGRLDNSITPEIAFESVQILIDQFGSNRAKANELFQNVASSTTEALVFGKFYLDNCSNKQEMMKRWTVFSVILRFIAEGIRRNQDNCGQLGFCLHLLQGVLIDERFISIHRVSLDSLSGVIKEVAGRRVQNIQASLMKDLLCIVFHVHEVCQRKLVKECHEQQDLKIRMLGRSKGINIQQDISYSNDDAWGWSTGVQNSSRCSSITNVLVDYLSIARKDIVDTLTASFGFIQVVISHGIELGLPREIIACLPLETIPQKTQAELHESNPLFCAQIYIKNFLNNHIDDSGSGSLIKWPPAIMSRLKSSSYLDTYKFRNTFGRDYILANRTLLISELTELERHLREQNLEMRWEDKIILIQKLSDYCSDCYSQEVRLLASRCLGEINLSRIGPWASLGQEKDWISTALNKGRLLSTMKARCVAALANCLKSHESKVSVTALETLKAITSSRLYRDYSEFLGDTEVIDLLDSFSSTKSIAQGSKMLLLSEDERQIIKESSGSNETVCWCFDTNLWIENLSDFESWICRVVPALLVCCCSQSDGTAESTEDEAFFRYCQRMSVLDAEFSTVMFPTIVLALLLNSNSDETHEPNLDRVLLDTWITNSSSSKRCSLSKCFNAVLDFFRENDDGARLDRKVVELIVECIDLLRRLTQHRFECSSNHRRNPAKNISNENRENLRRFIPYGAVLSVNGIHVAEACIQSNRFTAGLFYAEMFADARFRGSGMTFDSAIGNQISQSSENDQATSDISGYGILDNLGFLETSSLQYDAKLFLNAIHKCYKNIGEADAAKVVNQIIDSDFSSFSNASTFDGGTNAREQLDLLENVAHMEGHSFQAKLSIADALEGIELRNTLRCYVEGLLSAGGAFCEIDQASLKEKWYMCRLFEEQWNDQAFHTEKVLLSDREPKAVQSSLLSQVNKTPQGEILGSLGTGGFYEYMTKVIFALRDNDFETFRVQLQNARLRLLDQVTTLQLVDASLWKTLDLIDKLQTINDLEILSPSADSVTHFLKRAKAESSLCTNQASNSTSLVFKFSVDVHEITMKSLPKIASSQAALQSVHNHLIEHLKRSQSIYCDLGLRKAADAAIRRLYTLLRSDTNNNQDQESSLELLDLRIRKAVLLERHNDFSGAIRTAKHTIQMLRTSRAEWLDSDRKALMADTMVLCGNWMTKHKVEPAGSVLSAYFTPAADIASALYKDQSSHANSHRYVSALLALSQLALNIFENVSSRVKSLSWKKASADLDERRLKLDAIWANLNEKKKRLMLSKKKDPDAEKDIREHHVSYLNEEREVKNTDAERQKIEASVEEHRILALQTIVSALSITGVDDTESLSQYVYRLVAIWVQSEEDDVFSSISSLIKTAVENIPTFRFVPLASQLFSRIAPDIPSDTQSCQHLLQLLILKMTREHPYHCVAPLIALSNGRSGVSLKSVKGGTKADVASSLIQELKDTKDFHRGNTTKIPMEKVCPSTNKRLDKCLGTGARQVQCPPCVLTKPPPLRPGCDYGDGKEDPIGGERIASFESYFAVTEGGLHRPKIVVCIGSKGGRYRELVKGEDDTRQDAVMEQVFDYVNSMMARQRIITKVNQNVTQISTRSDLKLVTYNIIPLSPEAGVLEWVEHTVPFGDFIADKGGKKASDVGAHSRYFPGEWGHIQCRSHLDTAQRNDKRKAFDDICKHNSPVFRYFFVERFGFSSEIWYAAKMRYTRSVAVSSIVGHILGIGDRHTSNILVHQKTGEVVHIDFGIVFEQGKLLNTPEKVPFRLTRNMVDGMGSLGTEGTFTKAAEATLMALKVNANALLTILSAIVADPLYRWTIVSFDNRDAHRTSLAPSSDVKSRRNSTGSNASSKKQQDKKTLPSSPDNDDNDNKNSNEAADHAIRKIHEKLQGYEDGTSGEQQSVEGQVSLLVNSARDPDNLCYMYPGWAPWT